MTVKKIPLMSRQKIQELEVRIERLETFINKGYNWTNLLTDSTLEKTIQDTVKETFFVSVNAEIREN